MQPPNPERTRQSRTGLLPLLIAALFATGCGRMGGVSVRGPGIDIQIPPLGYSYGSSTPYYGGQQMDPRYGYAVQVPPNGQYMDPNQYYASQQQGYNLAGQYVDPRYAAAGQVPPNGQYVDPNQYYAAQQQGYYNGQQQPYAYNAAAPAATQATGAQPTSGGIPGAGLVASPFAPGTTQPLAGNVQARLG